MDTMGYQYPTSVARNDPQYVAYLEQRIAALEARLSFVMPRTKLISPSFMSRAFAVWGHYFVAQFIIGLIVGVIWMVLGLIFAGSITALLGPALQNSSY